MQFMPETPRYVFAGTQDPEYDKMVPQGKAFVEAAIAEGMPANGPFEIRVLGGETTVHPVLPSALEEMRGSLDEINALLGDPLPEAYTREGTSQVDVDIWADHLSGNWGF